MSAKSSILMRPAGMDPMVTSKNTTGFLGFGGRWCHSTDDAGVADGGVGPAEMADAMTARRKLPEGSGVERKKLRVRVEGGRRRAVEP